MTAAARRHTMLPLTDTGFSLQPHRKVVLVVDLVDSVRLMQADELGVIQRWQDFLAHVNRVILPAEQGRLVKSLGDGLLLEFERSQQAVSASAAMHAWMSKQCLPLGSGERIALRAGTHAADVYADGLDIYGSGVNLAARMATLAGPGETVATLEACAALADGVDGTIEDLGECYLKNIGAPVRAFRIGDPATAPLRPMRQLDDDPLRPTIAVIPFQSRNTAANAFAIGDLVADGVIAHLARSHTLTVISRLSTAAFSGRTAGPAQVGQALGANYLLCGSYVEAGARLLVTAELIDARSGEVLWAERLSSSVDDLLQAESELVFGLANGVSNAILDKQAARVSLQPLPTLESYALMLGGIRLMHRSTRADMARSQQLLSYLVERHPRAVEARAWLAKLFVLRSVCGFVDGEAEERARALSASRSALQLAPDHALALAVEGYIHTQRGTDADKAGQRLELALQINPNEAMAWLFKSVASAMWGSSRDAVAEAEKGSTLSPCDPLAYYVYMLRASALTIDQRHGEAIHWASQSLRLNRVHTPTLRVLLTAQVGAGQIVQAQATLARLLELTPEFSLTGYLAMGASESKTRRQCAQALRELGLK